MKRAFLALITFVASLAPHASAAEDYGAALQRLHSATVGYSFGGAQLHTITYTDTAVGKDGKTVETDVVHRMGMLFRTDMHDVKSGDDSSVGFTGNIFWYSDINGFTAPTLGSAAKRELTFDLLDSDGVSALPWTYERMETVDGKTLAVVRVAQSDALPIELYVDPETGLYRRAVINPKGDYEATLIFTDYAKTPSGISFLHSWKFADSDNTHHISNVSINPAFDPASLHPPAQSAHWEFHNGAPFTLEERRDRYVVHAKVNGIEGTFLLDTGAGNIVFSGAFARRAGLHAIGHAEISGPDIDEKTDVGIADTIDVNGNILHNARVYFGTSELTSTAPDGELGFDFFADAIVSLDLKNHTLQIAPPTDDISRALPGIHVRTDLSQGQPMVPMHIGDTVTLNAFLDTGAPREMLIDWRLPAKYGLHFAGDYCATLDDLKLGPITFKTPGACLSESNDVRAAIVGIRFFRGFQSVTFDYQHGQIVFLPKPKT